MGSGWKAKDTRYLLRIAERVEESDHAAVFGQSRVCPSVVKRELHARPSSEGKGRLV